MSSSTSMDNFKIFPRPLIPSTFSLIDLISSSESQEVLLFKIYKILQLFYLVIFNTYNTGILKNQ